MDVSAFTASLGVNTHIGSGPYNDPAELAGMLSYLGISNVRQSSPIDPASLAAMAALGQAGAKIDLIINGGGPVNLAGAMENVDALAPYLNAVEGVNEAAIYPVSYDGISGIDAAVALQKDLYAAVRSNPALDGASVYSFTIGGADPSAYPSIGDISAYTDDANIHSYPPDGLRPIFVIHAAIAGGQTDAPAKPVVLTETGYYTLTNGVGWGGVPQSLQASYLLDEVLDEAAAGVSRTYLYDLIDDGADPGGTTQEDHFGLFNNDGSPKASADAFHNLTSILASTDAAAGSAAPASQPFSFTVAGLPYGYTGNTLELDGGDGSHSIAIWNEEQLWNTGTLTAEAPSAYPVTVSLNAAYHDVKVYDPTTGSAPIQTLHDVSQVSLVLEDHPFVIQVEPDQPATVLGSGPDTLALQVSEDAYQGDAQFTVSVDGQQFGGVQTVTALHGTGAGQFFDIEGSFSAGLHQVAVDFLNDAYAGTPATDRNLYVDGVTIDTRPVSATLAEYSGGAQSFSFDGPVGTGPIPATAIGIGPQILALQMSEDAYMGNAHFIVMVDDQQVGGVQTASALHGLGQSQEFDVLGLFAAGQHRASVTFLNDAYDGTPQTDRNLYVGSATIGGVPVPDASLTEFSAGKQSFAFTVPGA